MKSFYLAVTVEQGKNETHFDGAHERAGAGYYSCVIKVSENDNLASVLTRIGGLKHASIMPSKARAAEAANYWNDCYKANGTYFYA